MNDIIFDKVVKAIEPTNVIPKHKELIKMLGDESIDSLNLFVLYGVLRSVTRTVTRMGEVSKFSGDFESYNCLTGEILKSDTCFVVQPLEQFMFGILTTANRPAGFEFSFMVMAVPAEGNRKDYALDFVMIDQLRIYDSLHYIRATAMAGIPSKFENALVEDMRSGDVNASGDADGVHYDGVKLADALETSFVGDDGSDGKEQGYDVQTVADDNYVHECAEKEVVKRVAASKKKAKK